MCKISRFENPGPSCNGSGTNEVARLEWEILHEQWQLTHPGKTQEWHEYERAVQEHKERARVVDYAAATASDTDYLPRPVAPEGERPPVIPPKDICMTCHGSGSLLTDSGAALIRFLKRHLACF